MEWVETTGRTIEAAKEAALDELGVDDEDAEFEVIQEPRVGLFGRVRSEARVRARVRPTAPRSKDDRRDRRRRNRAHRDNASAALAPGSTGSDADPGSAAETQTVSSPAGNTGGGKRGDRASTIAVEDGQAADGELKRNRRRRHPDRPAEPGEEAPAGGDRPSTDGEATVDVDLDRQGAVAREFLQGLVKEFDLRASVRVERSDDETVDLNVDGSDLGLLIGPRGATLLAIQDLTRTVVQRRTGATNGRLRVDVAGYRHKRAEALARFARQVAEEVRTTGTRKALEPMPAADRKVVHDAVADVEGVTSQSEGEDTQRRVVISPESS